MSDKDILEEALERFHESETVSNLDRQNSYDDVDFGRLGNQWPEKVKKQRELEDRPCLTINKLPAFIRQVVNDSRQNKPGIVVGPVDSGADVDTAHAIGGVIRGIERNSNADVAYDTAIDHSASGGFGFFRVDIDYAHEESFDLEARIRRIMNAHSVHWDVNTTEFDASDWNYAFVSQFVSEDDFERDYPDAEPVSFEGDSRETVQWWLEDDKIRIAEYWLKEKTAGEIVLLSDGTVLRADKMGQMAKAAMEAGGLDTKGTSESEQIRQVMGAMGLQEVKRRKTTFSQVNRYMLTGAGVLGDPEPWPGPTIPICPVWGEEVVHNGRRYTRSLIRDARDPALMFSYWRTASTELVALAPRTPFVGPKGFAKGMEGKWNTANTRSHAFLEYDPTAGERPTREPFAGVPAGALQEALNASDDMKAIIGLYDPSLGARSNETSGKAIMARQREGDTSTFHFVDNLSRAIRYAGRVLVDIIPAVYGSRETLRIIGADQKESVIKLTQQGIFKQDGPRQGGADPSAPRKDRPYNLAIGKYDVTVKAGPSYATQREEAREVLIEIMRQVPGSAPYLGDILADHLDFVGADKLKSRLQHLLPPQIQQAEGLQLPQAPQAQPDPLDQEERKAKIESLRASALASLVKAGVTQQGQQLDLLEGVLNAIDMGMQHGQPMPQPQQGNGAMPQGTGQ
jgi:hypothetical protein